MRREKMGVWIFLFMVTSLHGVMGQEAPAEMDSLSDWWMVDLEHVVVTAQYAPTHTKNALQNIRVITEEVITRQGATNLEQLLQQDLNIRIQQDAVLGSSLSLLGTGGENVKVMIDGVPVVGRQNGNIDLSQINLNNVKQIEIIEGPVSVAYGTDALGGVINIITHKSQRHPLEVELRQQLETRGEMVSNISIGTQLNDRLLLQANVGRDKFDGFSEDSLRSSLWNPKEQWYGDASLRYNLANENRIIYKFSYFDEEVLNLGNIRRPQFRPYAFDDVFETRRMDHSLTHEGYVFNDFYWQNTLGFNQFNRNTSTQRTNFESDTTWTISEDTSRFEALMLRSVFASNFEDSPINFQLGLDLRRETGKGGRILDESSGDFNESQIGDYALFGNLRYQPFEELVAEIGLRAAHNTRYEAPLIPSFHLRYQFLSNLTLRASYAQGFRSPSLKELFISFIDINHYIVGNPDLQAETSHNIQLNLNWNKKWNKNQWQGNLRFFYNDIKDQIALFTFEEGADGRFQPVPPDQSNQYAYFNIADARVRGINLTGSYQHQNFQIQAGLSRIYQFNPLSDDFDGLNRFTPNNEISGRVSYELPYVYSNLSLFFRHYDRLVSFAPGTDENGNSIANQQIVDGYSMLDATVSRNFMNDRLAVTAGVRNLLNVQQVNLTGAGGGVHSGGGGRLVGPGRSFFVNISYKLFSSGSKKQVNPPIEQKAVE